MGSTTADRLWRVCKEAGRPWPVIDETDDVIDFMIMEAVTIKINREEKKKAKEREHKEFKRDKEGLAKLREAAAGA